MVKLAEGINATLKVAEAVDSKLLSQLASQASGQLVPMNAFIGGFAAQEVMKVGVVGGQTARGQNSNLPTLSLHIPG